MFDLKRRMRQRFLANHLGPLYYDLAAYNVAWDPESDEVAEKAALLFTRFRILALRNFFSQADLGVVRDIFDAIRGKNNKGGQPIAGELCLQWKMADKAAWSKGLEQLKDLKLRDAYIDLFSRQVPRRLQRFFTKVFGAVDATDDRANDIMQHVESSLLLYLKRGDQRTHADHELPRTINTMASANGIDFYPTAIIDLWRAVAATTPPEKREAAFHELICRLQTFSKQENYLQRIMEPYARAAFGPFATTLATDVLPATTLVIFDPRTAHYGVGDPAVADQPRATAFNSYTSKAMVPKYNGDYTLLPEEFLLHKWYNKLRLQEVKPKLHKYGQTHSIFERTVDTFDDNPTRDDLERQEAFLNIATMYKVTRLQQLDSPKDISKFGKKQHWRFGHIRIQAKKRFPTDVKDGEIIDAFTNLRRKREEAEEQGNKKKKQRTE